MKTWISFAVLAFISFFQKGDAVIVAWATPPIIGPSGTGTLTFAENTVTGTAGVATTFAAVSDGTLGALTLLTSGTPFSVSTVGVLSLDTALDYETTSSYTIEIQAIDDTPTTGTATITVYVTDVNEAPAFASALYGACIVDGSGAGTTLTTVTATDQDSGDTIEYSLSAGNTGGHFSIASATGVVTVATGHTLSAYTTPAYVLVAVANDNDGTPLTGTTTIAVVVRSTWFGGSAAVRASFGLVMMMIFIKLLM